MITISLCCALAIAASAGEPIRVGAFYPLTGGSAPLGIALRNGVHLAAEEINAAGGVLGRKLLIIEADDEAKPDKGAQIARDLIAKEHVVALIGPANTGVANASNPIANQNRIPQIGPSSTGNLVNELFAKTPQNYVFRLAASDAIQSEMMVKEAYAARGMRRFALLSDQTPYGEQGRARVLAELDRRGLKPVYDGTFPVGATDMTAQVTAAKAAGAEVMLLYALGAESAAVARSLQKIDWTVPILGTWNLSNPTFLKEAGPRGNGSIMPQTFVESGATEPQQLRFIEAYKKKYALPHIDMGPAAAQAYDAVYLLALAVKQAGSTDGPRLKAALEDLAVRYEGATGEYVKPWSPDDHEAVTPANVVWGMVRDGLVIPADSAVGKAR
jgi:branched-chain amino acid transport system substrate-binding protein